MRPWGLRARSPGEWERERDSKFTALLGTPAPSTSLKAPTDCVKLWGRRGASEDGGNRHEQWYASPLTFSLFPMRHVMLFLDETLLTTHRSEITVLNCHQRKGYFLFFTTVSWTLRVSTLRHPELLRTGPQGLMLWTHLTRLQSVGYGGGGVQWEVDGMESGGGRAWVGLSPFMSPAIGMWVPIIGTGQKQEEQRGLLPSSVPASQWSILPGLMLPRAEFTSLPSHPTSHPKEQNSHQTPN